MVKQLKALLKKNPKFLDNIEVEPENLTRHFMFTVVDPGDLISLPVCSGGILPSGRIKHKMHAVDCPDCLSALEVYADADSYVQALAHASVLAPKIITPDSKIMKLKHGSQPSREASMHFKAKAFLDSKSTETPADLPKRMIGGIEKTFFKNMYEIGLIDIDGERTGLSAQDLADGKFPDHADKITTD